MSSEVSAGLLSTTVPYGAPFWPTSARTVTSVVADAENASVYVVPCSTATPLSSTPTPYCAEPAGTSTQKAPPLVSIAPSCPYATQDPGPSSNDSVGTSAHRRVRCPPARARL